MPRTCTICTHPEREEIDKTLLSGQLGLRDIARRYHASKDSLSRHKPHLSHSLMQAKGAQEALKSERLLDHARSLVNRTESLYQAAEGILDQATRSKDLGMALKAIRELGLVIREARGNATLLGNLTGELRQDQQSSALQAVIVIPELVPVGSPGDLKVEIPGWTIERAMVERGLATGREEGSKVIEVRAEQ
jgi:hypothetical protein